MSIFDPRLTPARPDLAAAQLRGKLDAEQFVEGRAVHVRQGVVNLRRAPNFEAPVDTQALYGEEATLYEDEEGWGWVQLAGDGYVGYLSMNALGEGALNPTHRVSVNRSFIYPCADLKVPALDALPLGALVRVSAPLGDAPGAFVKIAEAHYVFAAHLAPLRDHARDFVAVAERFLHAPYLWGGKTSLGIDCSGLVQVALLAAGVCAPRDTDLQERALGVPIDIGGDLKGLRRGDLIFWRGHVGVMRDEAELLHANAHHMLVASEPLRTARDRIATGTGLDISSVRRLKSPMTAL